MKENKYDNIEFFNKYKQMARSIDGLEAAGEWHVFKEMLPDFTDKRVLDLGCGFGWHCRYAIEQGAHSVIGIDISERMIAAAKQRTTSAAIKYLTMPIEDIDFSKGSFDIIISSLALHYLASCEELFSKINNCLIYGGNFVFSVEHPIYTANESQNWYYDEEGTIMHWPIDRYFDEGIRNTSFLGERVVKYHRTLAHYANSLIKNGFEIAAINEPEPDPKIMSRSEAMQHELRRPMFLIMSAIKK